MNRLLKKDLNLEAEGLQDLTRLVELTLNSKESLRESRSTLESMSEQEVERLQAMARFRLQEKLELPKVKNNLEHVEDQLLHCVIEDAPHLEAAFGIKPLLLRLLVVLHDLGKAEIPSRLLRVFQSMFPHDFVAREILTHEYASMFWVGELGERLSLPALTIEALQRRVANHNFGPNLCLPLHKPLRSHWWPTQFRQRVIPRFKDIGIDIERHYPPDEAGQAQYPHSEDDAYACLLALYDRAIATRFNEYGIITWKKFAEQNFNTWLAGDTKDPTLTCPFDPQSLTSQMEQAARWTAVEIDALWRILIDKHSLPGYRLKLDEFPPAKTQTQANAMLIGAIQRVKDSNPQAKPGTLSYRASSGDLYQVRLKEKQSEGRMAKLFWWDEDKKNWILAGEDVSPIKLYFDLISGDLTAVVGSVDID